MAQGGEQSPTFFCEAENCLRAKETPESIKGTQENGSMIKTKLNESEKPCNPELPLETVKGLKVKEK